MRRFILLAAQLVASGAIAQEWDMTSAFPGTARDDGAAFVIGPDVYMGTGREVGWGLTADWFRYHTTNDTWEPIASLPSSGRQYCTAFSIGNIGYLFGGTDGNNWLNELWAYDPTTNTWEQRSSLPGPGRSGTVSFVIDDLAYVTNGRIGTSALSNELWRYDPVADAWNAMAPMPGEERQLAASFALEGSAYVVGGTTEDGTPLSTGWRFDANDNVWSAITDLPDARFGAEGFAIHWKGLVVAGATAVSSFPGTCYWYDPELNSWSPAAELPAVRKGGAGGVVNVGIYYGTGVNDMERLNDWMKLDLPVGMLNNATSTALFLAPVAATDRVQVVGPALHHVSSAMLMDTQGRIRSTMSGKELQQPIPVGQLQPGAYVLVLVLGDRRQALRFIRL